MKAIPKYESRSNVFGKLSRQSFMGSKTAISTPKAISVTRTNEDGKRDVEKHDKGVELSYLNSHSSRSKSENQNKKRHPKLSNTDSGSSSSSHQKAISNNV